MGIGQKIIDYIENHRDTRRKKQIGAIGQFWRDGGNQLLFDLPITSGSLVIDGGGYKGEWSTEVIARYGCRSWIFEPVPEFFEICQAYFKNNDMVEVHMVGLSRVDQRKTFHYLDNGTSEYGGNNDAQIIVADVIDVSKIFANPDTRVACFKLNIEGGEYEVLERLLETNNIIFCDSLIIQFHCQPEGYEIRYKNIVAALRETHKCIWCYDMVWEFWVSKNICI